MKDTYLDLSLRDLLANEDRRIVVPYALVQKGLTNRQIAGCRGVSPLTTQNQIHHIFEKTDASNRRELMLAKVASIPEPLLIAPIKNNQPRNEPVGSYPSVQFRTMVSLSA